MKMKKYRVLIVDDVEENLHVVAGILGKKDIAISFAKNGVQAIKTALKKMPDLILLDINMPVMDGYEACKALKNDERTSNIPIIFLSALNEKENIVKGFDYGGVDYITKPFNKAELLSRVSTHLELKYSKDKLKTQNEELKELNATKDKFFSIIAHDLKSPFSALLGFSTLLSEHFDKYDVPKQKKFVDFIHDGLQSTHKLLDNLLLWSRTQRGIIDFNPTKENLYLLSTETIEPLKSSFVYKSIALKKEIPDDIFITVDKEMLVTILRNLISNAIKFTPKEGEITIMARTITNDNQKVIEITVKDNGVGISPKVQSKLFKITESVSTKGTEKETGTGLGLILCKEFVEKHNGKIWVESEIGKGSIFSFTIPC